MASGGGMTIGIRVDDVAVRDALRRSRRDIYQDVKKVAQGIAEETVLPTTKRLAPSVVRANLVVRSTTRGAYLSTNARGVKRKITGLLNFGGVVRTVIVPTNRKALYFGGRWVARVDGPRRYKAQSFMERSVDQNIGRFSDRLEEELARVIQSRVAYARTFG